MTTLNQRWKIFSSSSIQTMSTPPTYIAFNIGNKTAQYIISMHNKQIDKDIADKQYQLEYKQFVERANAKIKQINTKIKQVGLVP